MQTRLCHLGDPPKRTCVSDVPTRLHVRRTQSPLSDKVSTFKVEWLPRLHSWQTRRN